MHAGDEPEKVATESENISLVGKSQRFGRKISFLARKSHRRTWIYKTLVTPTINNERADRSLLDNTHCSYLKSTGICSL